MNITCCEAKCGGYVVDDDTSPEEVARLRSSIICVSSNEQKWRKHSLEYIATDDESIRKADRLFAQFRSLLIANGLAPIYRESRISGHRRGGLFGRDER